MPPSLFLIFNHQFTSHQDADARSSLGVDRIVPLPAEIRQIWGNVPPDLAAIDPLLSPVKEWLSANAKLGDAVLIQGDFGATFKMVCYALEKGLIPIYSTTKREAFEKHKPDGSVETIHSFRHVRFRRYLVE